MKIGDLVKAKGPAFDIVSSQWHEIDKEAYGTLLDVIPSRKNGFELCFEWVVLIDGRKTSIMEENLILVDQSS